MYSFWNRRSPSNTSERRYTKWCTASPTTTRPPGLGNASGAATYRARAGDPGDCDEASGPTLRRATRAVEPARLMVVPRRVHRRSAFEGALLEGARVLGVVGERRRHDLARHLGGFGRGPDRAPPAQARGELGEVLALLRDEEARDGQQGRDRAMTTVTPRTSTATIACIAGSGSAFAIP